MIPALFPVRGPAAVTWNPNDKGSGAVLSNGNLTLTGASTGGWARATLGRSSGKYYFETLINVSAISAQGPALGLQLITGTAPVGRVAGAGWAITQAGIGTWDNGVEAGIPGSPTYGAGDVVQIATDFTNIWWGINNVWIASGNPGTGANPRYSDLTGVGVLYPAIDNTNVSTHGTFTAHFIAADMTYSLPTGFTAWAGY